jgi:Uma2 family endonuclease
MMQCARGLDLYAYHDIGVRIPGVTNFQPLQDVVVMRGVAGYEFYAQHFQLAAEVLSPSNTRKEIGLKLRRYREAQDNLYAVVIDQREILIEVYARNRNWEPLKQTGADDAFEMPELGFRCLVGDLYRGTPLDPRAGVTR